MAQLVVHHCGAPLSGVSHSSRGLAGGKLCLPDTFPRGRAGACPPEQGPLLGLPAPGWGLGRKQAALVTLETQEILSPNPNGGGTSVPLPVNEAVVRSLLSQRPPVWRAGGVAERKERTHRDELDAVVGRGALDAQQGGLDPSSLEGLAHVAAFLLLGL